MYFKPTTNREDKECKVPKKLINDDMPCSPLHAVTFAVECETLSPRNLNWVTGNPVENPQV